MKKHWPLVFFVLYGVGCFAMGVGDILFPQGVGAASSWGIVPGWIREIGCFDLCLAVLCAACIREIHSTKTCQVVTRGLLAASLFIGLNNGAAYLQTHRQGHLQAVLVHVAAVVGALLSLRALAQRGVRAEAS
ncbi:MAG: hypothetical protein U0174_03285 [Polyangiaceae bacterium]